MKFRLLIALLLFFTAGCATVPRPSPVPAEGHVSLQDICQRHLLECKWDGVSQTVRMSYRGTRMQAMVGSNLVIVGNNTVKLSAPLFRRRGAIYVPEDFEQTVIGPAAASADASIPVAWVGKIVIDAGHGGKDPGAIGVGGAKEKDITLDIARRVRKGLEDSGLKIIMTRDSDEFISLARRTEMASQPMVDLFVSIHANANKSRRAKGIEVFYIGPLNFTDRIEAQRHLNEDKLCGGLKMKADAQSVKKIVSGMLYSYKQSMARPLADSVDRGLSNSVREKSRGTKTERYFVLRNTLVPAILVEVGFISNPKEAAFLKDSAYRQQIADAISKSVREFLHVSRM